MGRSAWPQWPFVSATWLCAMEPDLEGQVRAGGLDPSIAQRKTAGGVRTEAAAEAGVTKG